MTILGFHTQHELQEFADNMAGEVHAMIDAINQSFAAWEGVDAPRADAWKADWEMFYPRWYAADQAARATWGDSAPSDILTAEPEYQALVIAMKPEDLDPTSFDSLSLRLSQAKLAGEPVVTPSYQVTQPTAPDADLGAYKAATQVTSAVDAAAESAKKGLEIGTPIAALVALGVGVLALAIVVRR